MARSEGWFFTVISDEYGVEDYGPYDNEDDAWAGMARVKDKAISLDDDIDRQYELPEER